MIPEHCPQCGQSTKMVNSTAAYYPDGDDKNKVTCPKCGFVLNRPDAPTRDRVDYDKAVETATTIVKLSIDHPIDKRTVGHRAAAISHLNLSRAFLMQFYSYTIVKRMLHDLTPGGSEFYNDPGRCIGWIKQRFDSFSMHKIAEFKEKLKEIKEALQLPVPKDFIDQLQWSGILRGPGSGPMNSGDDGTPYPACPICHGLKEPNADFTTKQAVGHLPGCFMGMFVSWFNALLELEIST